MAVGNNTTIISLLILLVLLGFCTDFIFGRPTGAPPSACSNLKPQHRENPQSGVSPFSLVPSMTAYNGNTQRILVQISWPSNRYLRGIILQARPVGQSTPVGAWSISDTDQNNFQLMRCESTDDTITHRSSNDKVGPYTFSWHPPLNRVGNVQIIASFVENYITYWVNVAALIVDPCFPNPCLYNGVCNWDGINPTYTCTCPNGLSGINCDSCVSNPCLNSGACSSSSNGYTCACLNGFTGIRCETSTAVTDPCDPPPCMNGGTCYRGGDSYVCGCDNGYSGSQCQDRTVPCEPNPCYFGSTCSPANNERGYNCNCVTGYTGSNCETTIVQSPCDSDPCQNGGYCYQSGTAGSMSEFFCSCLSGFQGDTCQLSACASNPCLNGGQCSVSGNNVYHCTCVSVYIGVNCETMIDPCASTPCLNNGMCSSDGNGYTCGCLNFFSGTRCESQSACASMPCENGGTCDGTVNSYTCTCATLYTGTNCENLDFDPCMLNPCSGNGQCSSVGTTYLCTCFPGWTGVSCSQQATNPCQSQPCMNSGTCSVISSPGNPAEFTCSCLPSYQGKYCEVFVNPCASNPCQNGGQCFTSSTNDIYTCTCPQTHTGSNCETPTVSPCQSNPCQNGGQCLVTNTGYSCSCPSTHVGINCETPLNSCGSAPCLNGGQCIVDISGNYNCRCPSTHTGTNCETFGNPCSPSPCLNNGNCYIASAIDGYTCTCPVTHTGVNCETVVSPCDSTPCQNSGQCLIGNGLSGYFCACVQPFTGTNCEIQVFNACDSTPCMNGGTCSSTGSNSFSCACVSPFSGITCGIDNTCTENPPCQNGGTCDLIGLGQYQCRCTGSYSGDNCEIYNNPCEVSQPCVTGTCIILGNGASSCVCAEDYQGDLCETNRCTGTAGGCLNNGFCNIETGNCECSFGFTGPECKETVSLPPTFNNCPEPVLTYSIEEGTDMATITLTGPFTARDSNSQIVPVLQVEGPELDFTGDLVVNFEEGYRYGVDFVFSATDFANSRATCEFKIKLDDDEVPTVECPADIREVTTEDTVPIRFEGVSASDNLGEPILLYSTVSGGQKVDVESGAQFESTGEPVSIIVTARDSFDNEASCQFTVTVYKQDTDCSHFPDISNGQTTCDINTDGSRECIVTCDEGYFLSVPSPASYTCRKSEADKNNVWQPSPNADNICLTISQGKFMKTVSVIFEVESENCATGDTDFENKISADIIEALSNKGLCTLNTVTACNRDNYDIRCGNAGNTRRRRAITDLTVDIGVSGRVDSDTNVTAVQNDIDMLAEEISILADSGSLMVEVGGEMIASREDSSMVSPEYMTTCVDGQMPVSDGCVSCPTGSFYNYETTKCEFCDLNTYQEDDEQSTCVPCPDDKITKSTGSYEAAQCTDKSAQETIWTMTLIAVIGAAGGLVVLLILLIIILCCCRLCCSNEDDYASDSIGNLTHLNKAYEEDDDQEMTFTGTLENGRASVRTYQSIPADGYAGGESNGYNTHTLDRNGYMPHENGYTNGHVANGHAQLEPSLDDDRMVRIPSMSETVYNNYKAPVPDSPPPPPPVGAPAPPPPPPPPM